MYTKKIAKNGRVMYFEGSKIVSVKNIPATELSLLNGENEPQVFPSGLTVDSTMLDEPQLTQVKACIFCGRAAQTSKYINGQTAQLCDEDYSNHTTGEIAERMRLLDERTETATSPQEVSPPAL